MVRVIARAELWTDGSCIFLEPKAAGGTGFGGYAAVVRRGGHGWVRRGRVFDTTAVRMELRAIIEGLRSLPNAVEATVYVDVILAFDIAAKWRAWRFEGARLDPRCRHGEWAELIEQLERVSVRFELLVKGPRGKNHKDAHAMAGDEARALAAGLEYPHLIEKPRPRRRLGESRRLSGPPPPSKVWGELAELARQLTAEQTAHPERFW